MSVKSIENGTLGLAQIDAPDGTPSMFFGDGGIISVSSAQSGATGSNALATTQFVNQAVSSASTTGVASTGSYRWSGNYQNFGNNQYVTIGSSTLPTSFGNSASTSTGIGFAYNQKSQGESDLVNYSNTNAGGFNFSNISSTLGFHTLANLYANGASASILNLPTGSQYQIGGTNILDNVVTTTQLSAYATLASPALTGSPSAPTANVGTNTTQLATCAYVQRAVSGAGGFDSNTSYVWGSAYQTFETLINVGTSGMPTEKQPPNVVSYSLGTQFTSNMSGGQGESDLVNMSQGGAGGFSFQNVSSTNNLSTLGTLYKSGAGAILNLPSASSQFQVNGVNIARQFTPTTLTKTVATNTAITVQPAYGGISYTCLVQGVGLTCQTSTINGMTNVNVYATNSTTSTNLPTYNGMATVNGAVYSATNVIPIAILPDTAPAPSNSASNFFQNVTMYDNTGAVVKGHVVLAYSTDVLGAKTYAVLFVSTQGNFPQQSSTLNYTLQNFSFTYM